MKLKKIILNGFKSFYNKTEIQFDSGITAIVGPNGCGKSNVIDAIKWVLGEQSIKSLRGSKMEDVIFNGSELYRPLGMAEVSLVLEKPQTDIDNKYLDEDGDLLTITRRVFRSGESNYFLNNKHCRLKDIQEILLDTGLGVHSYCILQQGRVDEIINAKPEERRELIEEAAGVMKYRLKRKAAEEKMRQTEENLMRIQDIFVEVSRTRNALQRQAAKAKRYKQLQREAKQLALNIFGFKYKQLQKKITELEKEKAYLEDIVTKISATVAACEAELEETKIACLEKDHQIKELERSLYQNQGEIKRLETTREMLGSKLRQNKSAIVDIENDLENLNREKAEKQAQLADNNTVELNLSKEHAILTERLKEEEKKLEGKREKYRSLDPDMEGKRGRIMDLLSQSAAIKNEFNNIKMRIEAEKKKLEKLSDERSTLKQRLEDLRMRGEKLEDKRAASEISMLEIKTEVEYNHDKLDKLKGEAKQLASAIADDAQDLAKMQSRLNALSEMVQSLQGFSEGVRSLMTNKGDAPQPTPCFAGVIADLIQTDKRYEVAIEMGLGECFQGLITRQAQDALDAVKLLREKDQGRGSFIPADLESNPSLASLPDHPSIIGFARDLVKPENGNGELLRNLLGDLVVVEDLAGGLDARKKHRLVVPMVTLSGDLISAQGIITGGSVRQRVSGYLARKKEINELTDKVSSAGIKLKQLKARLSEVESKVDKTTRLLAELEEKMQQEEKVQSDLLREYSILGSEEKNARGREEIIQTEMHQCHFDIDSLQRRAKELSFEMVELDTRRNQLETELKELKERKKRMRQELDADSATYNELRVELSSLAERLRSAKLHRKDQHQALETIKKRINQELDRKSTLVKENEDIEKQLEKLKSSIAATAGALDKDAVHLAKLKDNLDELNDKLQKAEVKSKEKRKELGGYNDQLNDINVQLAGLETRMNNECESLWERFALSPQEALMEFDPGEMNIEQSQRALLDVRQRLDKMGDVNLKAINDFDEIDQRFQFLKEQQRDLQESLSNLRAAIRKIDNTCRHLFKEAFDKVNDYFQEVFQRLFDGGKARMALTDPTDLLTTGIEIVVQPPGKSLQKISLLSGGEKSLVAISLMVALFLHKPSPFCLMDEVDAALDEANVGRFTELLRDLSQITQLCLVTHNLHTMRDANTLYGVTMSDDGISSVLSACIDELVEQK